MIDCLLLPSYEYLIRTTHPPITRSRRIPRSHKRKKGRSAICAPLGLHHTHILYIQQTSADHKLHTENSSAQKEKRAGQSTTHLYGFNVCMPPPTPYGYLVHEGRLCRSVPTYTLFVRRNRASMYPVPYLHQRCTDLASVRCFKLDL